MSASNNQSSCYTKGEKYDPPFANDPQAYEEMRERQSLKRNELLSNPKRFQRISEREDRTDVPAQTILNTALGKPMPTYRDFIVCNSPIDYVLYHQVLEIVYEVANVLQNPTC